MIEFVRSRHVDATPERIWPFVDDVTAWPRWHHEAERVEGRPGSVVFARDATAEVTIQPDGVGSLVTYRLQTEPGSLRNTVLLRFVSPRPMGRAFEVSLQRLAALAERPAGRS